MSSPRQPTNTVPSADDSRNRPIVDVEPSFRLQELCSRLGISTLGVLADQTVHTLMQDGTFGWKVEQEIQEKLAQFGLAMRASEHAGAIEEGKRIIRYWREALVDLMNVRIQEQAQAQTYPHTNEIWMRYDEFGTQMYGQVLQNPQLQDALLKEEWLQLGRQIGMVRLLDRVFDPGYQPGSWLQLCTIIRKKVDRVVYTTEELKNAPLPAPRMPTEEPWSIANEEALMRNAVFRVIATIKPHRTGNTLKVRYGLLDGFPQQQDEIAKSLGGINKSNIGQVERSGINQLKHPTRSRKLPYLLKPRSL